MLQMVPYSIVLQDVYFDDESAEVVLSSLRLGDDRERSVEPLVFGFSVLFVMEYNLYFALFSVYAALDAFRLRLITFS